MDLRREGDWEARGQHSDRGGMAKHRTALFLFGRGVEGWAAGQGAAGVPES